MKVHPFVLLSQSLCDGLEASFSSDVSTWAADWFPRQCRSMVTAAPISETVDEHRQSYGICFSDTFGEHWVICSIDEDCRKHLGAMLLGGHDILVEDPSPDGIAYGLIGAALLDLVNRLMPLTDGEYAAQQDTVEALLPEKAFEPGNEALNLKVDINSACIHLWLPIRSVLPRVEMVWSEKPSNSGELDRPVDAIGGQKLNFEILLGSAELTLDMVSKLRVGDVIRLDKDLQAPLSLSFEKSPVRFSGYLGKQHDHFAFRIDSIQK
ncbi:MAG: FliM/FliN family flagellar motor switch protein [Desulfobacteraceae bacterium]